MTGTDSTGLNVFKHMVTRAITDEAASLRDGGFADSSVDRAFARRFPTC
jgi:hypothetical protein